MDMCSFVPTLSTLPYTTPGLVCEQGGHWKPPGRRTYPAEGSRKVAAALATSTLAALMSARGCKSGNGRPPRLWMRKPRWAMATARPALGKTSGSVGVHALVFAGGLKEADVRKAAEGAARAGYAILEIPLLDPKSVDAAMTKRVLEEYGLTAAASLGLPFDADVSSEDPGVVARGEERLNTALELAAAFGTRHLCGILYSAFGKYAAPPTDAGRANSVVAMQRLGLRAASFGIQVNLEVVNRYETNLLNTATQAVRFCDDVGEANVRIHLDTYHMNIEERSFRDAVVLCADRLGYVHLGESHRGCLGTGTVAWTEFFGALREVGYQGPLTFESFSNKVVAPYCVDALCVWRNLWEDSDELAQAARTFIKEHWENAGSGDAMKT